MGFRFRRRLRIVPGLWLNISKSRISTSIGRRGMTLNLTRRGARPTVGIPGTGLSWRGRRMPFGGGRGSSAHTTGPGEIGALAVLAAAVLILALVGFLAILAR